jgi:hypothetical protein
MPKAVSVPQVERAAVSLEPRTTTNCLDVATLFYGRHAGAMLRAWAIVALPACVIVYLLGRWYGFDVRLALVAVYAATVFEGVLVTLAAVPALFGSRLSLRGGLANARGRVSLLVVSTILARSVAGIGPGLLLFSQEWGLALLGFVLTLFPCGWLAVRTGFLAETAALRGLDERLHDQRTARLLREESGDLYSRACWIVIYFVMLWMVVFVTLDFAWYLVAGESPLVSRVLEILEFSREFGEAVSDAWMILIHDPGLQVELTAAGLLVYPLARLAWLFCYLDVRVRKDCWDMQLQFAEEVRRLKSQS